jgi:hypothetical protein
MKSYTSVLLLLKTGQGPGAVPGPSCPFATHESRLSQVLGSLAAERPVASCTALHRMCMDSFNTASQQQ